ncbi:hypothetical protein TKK_0015615 [Trichogramma kaykai]
MFLLEFTCPEDADQATNTENQSKTSSVCKKDKVFKPPPIFLSEVENINSLVEALKVMENVDYSLKVLPENKIKIQPKTSESYVPIINLLKEKGRAFYTYQLKEKKPYTVVLKNLVPQGSILVPTLYLLFTADLPSATGVLTTTYADDTTLLAAHPEAFMASQKIQNHLENVQEWLSKWRVKSDPGERPGKIPETAPRPPPDVESAYMVKKKAIGPQAALAVLANWPKVSPFSGKQGVGISGNSEADLDVRMSALGQRGKLKYSNYRAISGQGASMSGGRILVCAKRGDLGRPQDTEDKRGDRRVSQKTQV